jgi:hypothetical protein
VRDHLTNGEIVIEVGAVPIQPQRNPYRDHVPSIWVRGRHYAREEDA